MIYHIEKIFKLSNQIYRPDGVQEGADITSLNDDESDSPRRGRRELIVIAKPQAGLVATKENIKSITGADVKPLGELLASEGITLRPLFGMSEEQLRSDAETMISAAGADMPAGSDLIKLSLFYRVDAPDERLEELAESLRKQELIEAAYVKPPIIPARAILDKVYAKTYAELQEAETPDFANRQIYLNGAPEGIDARYAWTVPGGSGEGVEIIDVEGGWDFNHEDLSQNKGGMIVGVAKSDWVDHGTAVLGEIGGDRNGFGVIGMCPNAHISGASLIWPERVFDYESLAPAIKFAADRLRPGDIILVEDHEPGPRYNFTSPYGQAGYIAVEWWPDAYAAIRYAVNRHIIVVEAAGNGNENLDDPIYDINPKNSFPSWWQNPFRRRKLDSGAILVGAGSPPAGTHGRDGDGEDIYIDRSRLSFSNYGKIIDAQGWGREVTTTGYGDLWKDPSNPDNSDRWYTDIFSGTSSASPIVVGALACVQGVLRKHRRNLLSPARARKLLRETGSPQQDAPERPRTQRIGNRPNIRQMIPQVLGRRADVQFTGTVPAGRTRCYQSPGWPAEWHVRWTVVPIASRSTGPQITWKINVERSEDNDITYWIYVTNGSSFAVNVEGRYAILEGDNEQQQNSHMKQSPQTLRNKIMRMVAIFKGERNEAY